MDRAGRDGEQREGRMARVPRGTAGFALGSFGSAGRAAGVAGGAPGVGEKTAVASDLHEEAVATVARTLSDTGRFSYAALCAISLASLLPTDNHSEFRKQFTLSLTGWLDLPVTVQPIMEAFAEGTGGEGCDSFVDAVGREMGLREEKGDGFMPLVQDLVMFSLKDGCYDARAHVLVRHIAWLLRVTPEDLEDFEDTVVSSLSAAPKEETPEELEARKKAERKRKIKRYLLIGLATTVGGTLLGVTGGLAAPLVAAGAGVVIGGAGAAALGSTAGIAIMTSLFGAAGAGLTGYKMKKRVGQVEEFEFVTLTEGHQLNLTIAITGWLSSGKYGSFETPWRCLHHSREQYCLVWESQYLRALGRAIESIINGLLSMAAQEALKLTVLSGILAALAWPSSLLLAANVIDNPWDVCLNRAAETGKQLARVLLSRQQGKRPVTLIGFSLGARVIFHCLEEMSKEKGCEGIVEDAVLLGAPVQGSAKRWDPIARVVSGRITNGYCRGDWLLKFLYRSSSVQLNVAGLQPVCTDSRQINNVDLSAVVNGHMDYMKEMETVLRAVGIRTRADAVATAQSLGGLQASGCSDQAPSNLPSAEQPSAEQPSADQPSAEQPSADQPSAEQPSAEQPSAEQPSAGQTFTDEPRAVEASSDASAAAWLDNDEAGTRAMLATEGGRGDGEFGGSRAAGRGVAGHGGTATGREPDGREGRVGQTGRGGSAGKREARAELAMFGGGSAGACGLRDGSDGEASAMPLAAGRAKCVGELSRGNAVDAPDILGPFDAMHFGDDRVGGAIGAASRAGDRQRAAATASVAAARATDRGSDERGTKEARGATDENYNESG